MGHGCLEFQVDPYMGFFMAKKTKPFWVGLAAAAHRTLDRVILGYTQPFPIWKCIPYKPVKPPKAFEPSHKFFVSQNWKSLIERRPDVAPKAKQELERDLQQAAPAFAGGSRWTPPEVP